MTGLDGAEWNLSTNHVTLYEATRVQEPDTAETGPALPFR